MSATAQPAGIAAIILAGGRARRLGTPKPAVRLDGETLLDRSLRATTGMPVVVVGPPELGSVTARHPAARVTREDPPFSGPAAAIAAGLDELAQREPGVERALVLACDLVRSPEAVALLLSASHPGPDRDDLVLADASGQPQWLCGLYGVGQLREVVARLRAANALEAAPARALLKREHVRWLPDPGGLSQDIDTPADLIAAREEIRQ